MSKENLINKISQLPDSPIKVSGKINSSDIKEILTENAQGYSENDLTDELKEKLEQNVISSQGITSLVPEDGKMALNGSQQGAIKISLPQGFTDTMLKFEVDVYDYTKHESIKLYIAGYTYGAQERWLNTSVQIIGTLDHLNYPVRFGYDGGKCVVYIGELNSNWAYPTVLVSKGMFSYGNFTYEKWIRGWNVSLETSSFQSVTMTHTDNLLQNITDGERTKLEGIENGANNYIHPSSHSISEVSGLQSALNEKADKVEDIHHIVPENESGWYTIAVCPIGRAIGRFGIRDVTSGRHQACVFYATHIFGIGNTINIISNAYRVYAPFEKIRIKSGGTYDGAVLQVYINAEPKRCELGLYLLGDNIQHERWRLVTPTIDSVRPEEIPEERWNAHNVITEIDVLVGNGANNSTGDVYVKGKKLATEEIVNTLETEVNSNLDTKVDKESGKGLSSIDLTGDLKEELASGAITSYGEGTVGGITTLKPRDASLSLSSGQIGAWKITLPQSYSNTMMQLEVDLFDYSMDESIKLFISGYNYEQNFWANTTVQILGSKESLNYPVRFGHDGEKCCIYIGELNSTWNYPKIMVTKGMFGFGNHTSSKWLKGWKISLETNEFKSVTKHHTDNLIRKMTEGERTKLAGIEDNANNYVHPTTHSISEVAGLTTALNDKMSKLGFDVSSGDVTTPINTGGWFKLAEVFRGGGVINLSFSGGHFRPTTYRIKFYKDWSSTGNLILERYGDSQFITEARIIQDTDSKYYLEINCTPHDKGLNMAMYFQPILGYKNIEVFTGEMQSGASSGSPIAQAYFTRGVSNSKDFYLEGRIGIGEHNPSENLEIYDSNTSPSVISLKSHRVDNQFVDIGQIVAKQDSTEVAKISMPRATGTFTGFMSFWTKENNSAPLVESMRINHEGKVGIGTTDPGQGTSPDPSRKVMVDGGVTVSKGSRVSYDADYFTHAYTVFDNSYPEARFKNYGYYGYRWDTRGGTQMVLLGNNGNLGLGTINPTEDISIYNNSARLSVTGASGSSAILLGNQDGGGVDNPAVVYGANGSLYFGGGTSWDRGGTLSATMQVNDNGRVGIGVGTGTPQQKLHVKGGQMRIESPYGYGDLGAFNADWFHFNTDRPKFYFNRQTYINGDLRIYGQNTFLRHSDGAIIQDGKKVATENQVNLKVDKVSGKGLSTNDYTNTDKSLMDDLSSQVHISSGNFGIGTTNPTNKLHVKGGSMKLESDSGYAYIGSLNENWFHFNTDRPAFYFYQPIYVAGQKLATESQVNQKVDKVSGKGLSTNDFTNAEKQKLQNLEEGSANTDMVKAVANEVLILTDELKKARLLDEGILDKVIGNLQNIINA